MAVPRNRLSNSKKGMRRSHHGKSLVPVSKCPECNADKAPHSVCLSCGKYNGRQILNIKAEE